MLTFFSDTCYLLVHASGMFVLLTGRRQARTTVMWWTVSGDGDGYNEASAL